MNNQETKEMQVKQKSVVYLEDLAIDDARQDAVTGGQAIQQAHKYRALLEAASGAL